MAITKGKDVKLKDDKAIKQAEIINDSDPRIRDVAFPTIFPLPKKEEKMLIRMIDYVRASQNEEKATRRGITPSLGIAAPQLGSNKKIIYVCVENNFGQEEEFALINPVILETSKEQAYLTSGEGCLSVPNVRDGYVYRPYKIKIAAIDFFTETEVEISAEGKIAIVLQHEMDHLSGILYYDHINKKNPFFKIHGAVSIKE
jgi:peptide deformylase